MTPNEKLAQLERALEAAMVEAMRATNGAGLKIVLIPPPPVLPGQHPTQVSAIPTCKALRQRIVELVSVKGEYLGYRGEEAAARNVVLLARVWEAAVRYWDFKRELDK